jgi:hypothetical protein
VRALWAGSPLLWQAYPQADGAHAAKVRALAGALALPAPATALWEAWNGLAPWPGLPGPTSPAWGDWALSAHEARAALAAMADLATQLQAFVFQKLASRA